MAFFYGDNPPWSELQAFDLVVVDPDHVSDPQAIGLTHTRLAAYVAVGEVQPSRNYAANIPKGWLVGENKDWGSRLIDQSRPEWPRFFTDSVVAPLWDKGYRTFFLDTLDSYHLFAKTPEKRAAQEAGMVAVINTLTQRYPDIKLIFNRGFEILPQTHKWVETVVAESLFQGFDAGKGKYKEVRLEDREWLTAQLRQANETYKLAVVVIDYVPPTERELARKTVQRIKDLGFTPWVATPDLASLGVGSIEVMPRKVLVVHSILPDEYSLRLDATVRLGAPVLNHAGYVPVFSDSAHLPEMTLAGSFAGIVVWMTAPANNAESRQLTDWLTRQLRDKVPIVLINPQAFLFDSALGKAMGLLSGTSSPSLEPIEVMAQNSMMGFEAAPRPSPDNFMALAIKSGDPLLTLKQGANVQVAAAIMPWGGFVMDPYAVMTLASDAANRWVINPFEFFQQALRLPLMPVPDVTTESGRRMLMVHMDGDGFISRSELPGNPLAGEVVRDRVVKKYPLPMTISVIEAELSPNGLYPSMSAHAENIAREIFRAPNVAIASHSYSHPFYWSKAGEIDPNGGYNLRLPGYQFDLYREIDGSISYINSQLAPPGKKVSMFLWTGDCVPGAQALAKTASAGVLNMNGGDTTATQSSPTITEVEGLGLRRGKGYQVFAPNQNENVYTNNWTGPFYGFERVIETFEFTESPRRLKPINIYFHTYLTTKAAGMKSLDKVFAWALAQETTPVFVSDYARKVLDFQDLVVARTDMGWRIRGGADLRTLRVPAALGWPDLAQSRAVAGYTQPTDDLYVHLSEASAELVLRADPAVSVRLVSANAHIENFETLAQGYRWNLAGYVPLKFTLANVDNCSIRIGSKELRATHRAGILSYFEIKDHAARPLEAICRG